MKYLVVDDDQIFADALVRALTRSGQHAMAAFNSAMALEYCAAEIPDRIVLDLKIGSESGLTLISELKAISSASEIVLLTGYSSIPTAVEAIKLGAKNYLCKPADLAEIDAAFEQAGINNNAPPTIPDTPLSVERLEWEHIQRVLANNNGNISATARTLGMHRRTLQRKLMKRPHKS